jgi:hypothetical protein
VFGFLTSIQWGERPDCKLPTPSSGRAVV